MEQVLIPMLSFVAVAATGGAVLRARTIRNAPVRGRLEALKRDHPSGAGEAGAAPVRHALQRLGQLAALGGPSANLKQELARAGHHGAEAAAIYLGSKTLLLVAGSTAAAAVSATLEMSLGIGLLLTASTGISLFFLPNVIVQHQCRQRQAEIRRYLPDAIDLLEICVMAGMGLDAAWNAVSEEMRPISPRLADEMALANLEIHLGAPRVVALRHLADRTGAEEISALAAVIVQSERFGTSIADALTAVATSLREQRSQRAEEAAERMPVKLLVPMILFILPAMLAVVVGPAGIVIARYMSGD